ncbi:MAG TPA: hypothetical protein VGY55_18535 [Pirellulales bacterium]|nr:hypothetical protein [Pirellulales bacterium]
MAGWLLALATLIATGCMPRGPFPLATLFGEKEPMECRDCGCCNHRRNAGRQDDGQDGNSSADTPAPILAPHSNFHPVPTRPVFTPWAVESPAPEEISGQLAWKNAVNPGEAGKRSTNPQPVEQPSSTPIARRTLPLPATLPDEKSSLPRTDQGDSNSPGDPGLGGWRAAPLRF